MISKRKHLEALLTADSEGWKAGRDAGYSTGYADGHKAGKALALVSDEIYAAGRDEGLKTGEGLLGEILKAAFADPIRVRYAYEQAKDKDDPSKVSYKTFLRVCGEAAAMTEAEIEAKR